MSFTAPHGLWDPGKKLQIAARGVHVQNPSSTAPSSSDGQGDDLEQALLPDDDLLAYLTGKTTSVSKRPAHDTANIAPPRKKKKGAPPPSSACLIGGVGGSRSPSWSNANKLDKRKYSDGGKRWSCDSRFKKRWKQYTKTRSATLKKDRAKQNSDVVARAHDHKVASLQSQHRHTFRQLRENARSATEQNGGSNDSKPGAEPSLPQRGWSRIQTARMHFAAASRGLWGADRRHQIARLAEQSFLDAARTLIAARRNSEENLRLALAQANPYWDLLRWRLERDLQQSIADTSEIVLLSTTRLLSRASATALANAKVDLFSREKLAARLNRERQVCRVNGAGSDSSPPIRLSRVKPRRNFSVPLPRRTNALVTTQASVPDSRVSPRLQVVFSQLRAIDTATGKTVAEAKKRLERQTSIVVPFASK